MIENNKINFERMIIIQFLQWNDPYGCYTDENCELEKMIKLSYNDAVKFFFGVINCDFYYSIVDNIFELTYDEVINYAKENDFYNSTIQKLNLLLKNIDPTDEFYRSLIE
ncbi:hypothetical protein PNU17_12310 [Turicibacter sanguinis]|uniref:hypothetical protein n=1 Tax=Turicibacter sanguinis TaxID=154288 RepID=UPI001E63B39A|nr:hypothetical protein [Turicibacter sanguinis]MDB8556551.1 hypothetical protein [Turicibacter sanguinis]